MRYTTRQLIEISTGCEQILLGDKAKIEELNAGVLLRLFSSHEFKYPGYGASLVGMRRLRNPGANNFANHIEHARLLGPFQTLSDFILGSAYEPFKGKAKRPIAFFSLDQTAVYVDSISGLGIDRQIDPIIKSLPKGLEAIKVHVAYSEKISLAAPAKYKLDREAVDAQVEYGEHIYGDIVFKLLSFLELYFESADSYVIRFNKFISKLLGRVVPYLEILKTINPSILFVRCFYNYDWLSLKLAANKLRIPLIDIQHGLVGPYHMAYTHWNHYSSVDLKLLPTRYLLWNKDSALQLISGNFGAMGDQCLIQGDKTKHSQDASLASPIFKLNSIIPSGSKVVLVLLAPLPYKLPDFFYELLTSRKNDDIFWLLKAHPTDIQRVHLHYVHNLMGRESEKVSMDELVSSLPLAKLLKHVNFTVSGGSSGLAEAIWSGGVAIGLTEEAREQFEHMGRYYHADSKQAFMRAIELL